MEVDESDVVLKAHNADDYAGARLPFLPLLVRELLQVLDDFLESLGLLIDVDVLQCHEPFKVFVSPFPHCEEPGAARGFKGASIRPLFAEKLKKNRNAPDRAQTQKNSKKTENAPN